MKTLVEMPDGNKIDIKYLNIVYDDAYNQALEDMLELSEEWKNNHGSFLDFQRVLRSKLKFN